MHNSLLSGHLGVKKTRERILHKFYWFDLKTDVKLHIQSCDTCAANKEPKSRSRAPLGSMPVGTTMDRLSTDVLGPLPLTPRGNRFILTVMDYFTKWVEIIPIPDQSASTCAEKIVNEVIARYGCPLDLHSDQGRNYESTIFKEMCALLGIRKTRTSARNPKGNGLIERFNHTIIHMIKSFLRGEQSDWDLNLGCLAAAYRSTPQESTGMSPNLLMLGREVRSPAELMYGITTSEGTNINNYGEYVENLRQKFERAHEVCRKHLSQAANRQKNNYDVKQKLHTYKRGDLVWLLNEVRKESVCPKLQPAFIGPFVVTMKISDLNYRIQKDKDGHKVVTVHHDKLKPYQGQNPPKWAKKLS